jgi:hypothetical protein
MRSRQSTLLIVALLIIGLWPASLDVRAQGNSPTFSGEATVVKGSLAGISLSDLAGTGPLAPEGGERENSLVCYPSGTNCTISSPVGDPTNGALSARVLHASTVGHGNRSRSEASVASLSLTVADVPIEAEFVRSAAQAVCQAGVAAVAGASELVNLTAASLPVEVTGAPNQTHTVPTPLGDVTIVINEQEGGASGNTGEITVNALHITFRDPAGVVPATDLIIAQAHADITCAGQPVCTAASKVTSGGWVDANSAKVNFAAAGKNLDTWGHFLAINHGTGDRLKATSLKTTFDADGFAVITGVAQVNGNGPFDFTAKLKDNGEPGKGVDQFSLTTIPSHPSFEVPQTTLGGGNVQFHKPCKP